MLVGSPPSAIRLQQRWFRILLPAWSSCGKNSRMHLSLAPGDCTHSIQMSHTGIPSWKHYCPFPASDNYHIHSKQTSPSFSILLPAGCPFPFSSWLHFSRPQLFTALVPKVADSLSQSPRKTDSTSLFFFLQTSKKSHFQIAPQCLYLTT